MQHQLLLHVNDVELREILGDVVAQQLQRFSPVPPEPNDSDELLTQKQAAAMLQVSKATLIRWGLAGKIKSVRIGRTVRYRRSDLNGKKGAGR